MKLIYTRHIIAFAMLLSASNYSCKKYVEVDPPRTELIKEAVFTTDLTADAAMADVYKQFSAGPFANGSAFGTSYCGALLSDEVIQYSTRSLSDLQPFNDNSILPVNSILTGLWKDIYVSIYKINAILEGIASSSSISANVKTRLEGEAKFMRAFCNFYLVNLWGDIPLVLTTDYRANNSINRSSKTEVYAQIVKDLIDAQNLLSADYSLTNNERIRANKWVATALLSRVYLFTEDWVNAEAQASSIIDNTSLYNMEPDLLKVFRATSSEAIFQIWFSRYPQEFSTFLVHPAFGGALYGAMRPSYASSFETGDQRRSIWVMDVPVNGTTYYRISKYQSYAASPDNDYSTVLRLAEQYLIRAEARAKQNKITGTNSAETDLNIIRARAGLGGTSATTESTMLLAIEEERKHELFGEWGLRWLDLKRTGRANAVLGLIKPDWKAKNELLPIPEIQIINDPNVTQNPGY